MSTQCWSSQCKCSCNTSTRRPLPELRLMYIGLVVALLCPQQGRDHLEASRLGRRLCGRSVAVMRSSTTCAFWLPVRKDGNCVPQYENITSYLEYCLDCLGRCLTGSVVKLGCWLIQAQCKCIDKYLSKTCLIALVFISPQMSDVCYKQHIRCRSLCM